MGSDRTRSALAASGSFWNGGNWLNGSGLEPAPLHPELPGFDNPDAANHYINAVINIRGRRQPFGGDLHLQLRPQEHHFLQQRWIAYYNSQCCGVGIDTRRSTWRARSSSHRLPQDRRFNISFTLAGIGTFSNLFGAFGGQQSR